MCVLYQHRSKERWKNTFLLASIDFEWMNEWKKAGEGKLRKIAKKRIDKFIDWLFLVLRIA